MQSVIQGGACRIPLEKYNPSAAPWPGYCSKQEQRAEGMCAERRCLTAETAYREPLGNSG